MIWFLWFSPNFFPPSLNPLGGRRNVELCTGMPHANWPCEHLVHVHVLWAISPSFSRIDRLRECCATIPPDWRDPDSSRGQNARRFHHRLHLRRRRRSWRAWRWDKCWFQRRTSEERNPNNRLCLPSLVRLAEGEGPDLGGSGDEDDHRGNNLRRGKWSAHVDWLGDGKFFARVSLRNVAPYRAAIENH